ncbi:MAG: DUF3987 domain-containing protein [Nitrosomonas sp.]|nr:DUF3987 domain-containing protein [Nitrosomonas sp.]
MDIIKEFTSAMQSTGMRVPTRILADGKIHRFNPKNGNGNKKDAWYVLYKDGIPAGAFGNWKTGEKHFWCSKSLNELSIEEHKAQRLRITEINEQRNKENAAMHETARNKAAELWELAGTVDGKHPYLVAKQVKPIGIKQLGNALVVPLRDAKGVLHSLQFIRPNGSKRFLTGGQKKGGFAMLGKFSQTICICEGWATGSSIFEATGYSVAVAFDTGNLLPIAQALRKKYPDSKIVICADDDYKTDSNPGTTAARATAQAIDGLLAIPFFDKNRPKESTDFNDLHQKYGLDAVKRQTIDSIQFPMADYGRDKNNATDAILEGHLQQTNEWPPLLLPGTIKLPEIGADILPGWAGDMVKALAEEFQVSESAIVLVALSMIATTAQGRFEVAPRGHISYTEVICLWVLILLRSGSNKTQILNKLREPLNGWEKLTAEFMRQLIFENEATRRVAEKRIKKLETKGSETDDLDERRKIRDEIRRELEEMPQKMRLPRLITSDVTPERLQNILEEQHERISVLNDEAGIFQILGGQYSGGAAMLDIYLQAYSGSPVLVDRHSRQVRLEKPVLTFCSMIQPGMLQDTANDKRFHYSGLLARFLYAIPEDRIGLRNVRKQNPVPVPISQAWQNGLHDLLIEAEKPNQQPKILLFTLEAQERWLDFKQNIEDQLGMNGKLYDLTEWCAKLAGNCARIAGLIQLVKTGRSSEYVDVDAVNRAIRLCEKLIDHAKAAFRLLGSDVVEADALHLMQWIISNKLHQFDRSHAQKSLEGRFRTVEKLKVAIQRLYDWNVLSEEQKRENKGARPTPYYKVNPKLFDNSTNSL